GRCLLHQPGRAAPGRDAGQYRHQSGKNRCRANRLKELSFLAAWPGLFRFACQGLKLLLLGKESVMKLWSGPALVAAKKLLFVSFAVAAVGLPSLASAETDAAAHAQTAPALKCLLDHGPNNCR